MAVSKYTMLMLPFGWYRMSGFNSSDLIFISLVKDWSGKYIVIINIGNCQTSAAGGSR